MSEYTPDTGYVRACYVEGANPHRPEVMGAQFDRWLANRDRDQRDEIQGRMVAWLNLYTDDLPLGANAAFVEALTGAAPSDAGGAE